MKNNAGDIGGSVMIPEESYFDFSYADPSLNDPTANANFTHIGLHLYGGQLQTYTNAISKGKKVWMTEHYYDPDDIGTALTAAKEIMDCLNDQMNGYVWWCLVLPNCNLINTDGSIQLKGYVMGQFSKYVRPGSNRVTATYSPQSGVTVVAFTGASNIIIAVNQNTSAKTQAFSVTKGNFTNPKRYTTSSSKKLADAGSTTVANGSFTATLDAQSITTFISDNSTGIKSAPTWIPALVQTGRKISGEGAFLQLRDFRGRVLRTAEGEGGHLEMDLSGLREGIYLATSGRNSIPVSILGR
jgi:glucuronoarabinoxylan endo-1,4-beta-xylanase